MSRVIVGLDPALGNMGVCVLKQHDNGKLTVLTCGVVRTKAKTGTIERGMELARALWEVATFYRPNVLAYEGPSMPPNAGSAWKIGVAFGVIAGWAEDQKVDMRSFRYAPVTIKETVLPGWRKRKKAEKAKTKAKRSRETKGKKAGKDDMVAAIRRRFPDFPWPKQKGLHEHVADACGACLTFLARDG